MAADCRIPKKMSDEAEETEGILPLPTDVWMNEIVDMKYHSFYYSKKRTKCQYIRSKLMYFKTIYTLVILLLVLLNSYTVCSLSVDCDSVKSCICGREDGGGWRIECPNVIGEPYPIELIVQKLDSVKEAILIVTCDQKHPNKTDPWSYIKGMDLSAPQIYAKIVRLIIRYCPPVEDGWSNLLKRVNLTGLDILSFSFVTDDKNAEPVRIPSNFFKNIPNIEILNLSNNKLTTVPDLSSLKNLKSINLRFNDLEKIPAEIFAHNTQLVYIALTKNKISFITPGTFPTSVEHLELNFNEISFLNSSMFSDLKNLRRLYLDNNRLDNIDSNTFDGMISLEDITLYNSMMTQFPNFVNLPKLTNLTISTAISFKTLTTAQNGEFDVTTTLAPDYLPENTLVLKNLPSLENLILPLNHFTSLPTLENLPKLTKIVLERNELTEIERGAFKDLPSLKELNLRRNKIKNLAPIEAFSLVELQLQKNRLTVLPNDTFRYLTSLRKLNLANNSISTVSHKLFEPMIELHDLDLSYNQITFSSPPYYADMRTTEQEHFAIFGDTNNQSPLRSNLKLRNLKLSHNNISTLGFSDWAQVFTQINEIDLSYNKIRQISANELNFISYNLTVNLENNEISTVDLRIGFLLEENSEDSKQVRVFLDGNPLRCDCLAYDLKIWKLQSYDLRIRNLNCASPPSLKGRRLRDVPNENLLCNMSKGSGCPDLCNCQERTVDKTVLIDCSGRNLTLEEIPKLNTFIKNYAKYSLELDLSNNQITDFNNTEYMKQFLNKTRQINLTGNNLTSTMFLERVAEYQQTTFSIANNPFPCTNCIGFQIPWRAYPTRISDLANVTCQKKSSDNGRSDYELVYVQENSKEFETYCADATKLVETVIIPLVVAVIFLSFLCIGLFITIRYGWTIKAYLYSKGLDWCLFWEKDLDADEETDGEKLYDAFISYSHKDEDWVLDELVKRLEGQDNFKLCLHFRDWTPGDWIPDQIVRSVDKSRRTVVVLSKNFVESVWSRLEFKAAHAQALKERSNRVILILIGDDLKESDVQDDDLKMYMKMNTFMKWNDPLFWHRLKYALPHKKTCNSSQPTEEELKQNAINKMQQRDRAIKLDKLRAKLEQNV